MTIYVIGYQDKVPDGASVVETTSRSKNWSKGLSPFFVGPVKIADNLYAKNVENAWQFSKIYEEFFDKSIEDDLFAGALAKIKPDYIDWAIAGWNDDYAHRYPMGKGKKPLFSVKIVAGFHKVDGNKTLDYFPNDMLSYIEARKKLYIPFYAEAVLKTEAYSKLEDLVFENPHKDLYLKDFDGYDHKALGMSYDDVINCESRKMGHAFVLAMLLDGFINKNDYLVEPCEET